MAKKSLLLTLGLVAAVSAGAQTKIATVGFEDGEVTGDQYRSKYRLSPEKGTIGDWVNVKEGDTWVEQSSTDAHSGEYALYAGNYASDETFSWDRGFKIANLPIKEHTSYRVSFWIKGPEDAQLTSWLSKGLENFDQSLTVSTSGTADYGLQINAGSGILTGEWQKMSYVVYYKDKASMDAVANGKSWVGNATFPEEFGGDGTQTYKDYFNQQLPEEYFAIFNMWGNGEYFLDDICVEENVALKDVSYCMNVVKIDFGYKSNIAALAKENNGSLVLDPSQAKVTCNGENMEVLYLEGKTDGYVYAFLDEDVILNDDDEVLVSYTPNAENPIILEFTFEAEPEKGATLPFENQEGYEDEDIDVIPSVDSDPVLVETTLEDGSFNIHTVGTASFTFNKEIDPTYVGAVLIFGKKQTDLSSKISVSEDGMTLNIPVDDELIKTEGDYVLYIEGVMSSAMEVNFSVGEVELEGDIEVVFEDNIAASDANGLSQGWSAIGGENGDAGRYAIEGNLSGLGGSPRNMYNADELNHGIYICQRGGATALKVRYGAIGIDTGNDDLSINLEPGKYLLSYKMARWDGAEGIKYQMEFCDAEGVALFTHADVDPEQPDGIVPAAVVANYQGGTDFGVKPLEYEFMVEDGGKFYIEFTAAAGWGGFLLQDVTITSVPSSSGAKYMTLLNNAIEEAETMYLQYAEDPNYAGEALSALDKEISNAEDTEFHTPSEINAQIKALKDAQEALATRAANVKKFVDNIDAASLALLDLEGTKYADAEGVADMAKVVDQYADTPASAIDDATLAEIAPIVETAAGYLTKAKDCTDRLTWGLYKATQTYNTVAASDEAALNAALAAISDDRAVAADINAANNIAIAEIIVSNGNTLPEDYFTEVNKHDKVDEFGDVVPGESDYDCYGVEVTGLVQNPKLYRKLNVADVPGWKVTGVDGGAAPSIFNNAPSAVEPVTDANIEHYMQNYFMSQTIEGMLPGIYTVKISTRTYRGTVSQAPDDETDPVDVDVYYNAQNDETGEWDKYIYADNGTDKKVTPFLGGSWGYGSDANNTMIKEVEVGADGILTIGIVENYTSGKGFKNDAKGTPTNGWEGTTMADDVRLFLTAPLPGYDYSEFVTAVNGIEAPQAAAVSEVFSVGGAKVAGLQKGINIVKYANGDVRKVLVK